MDNVEATILNPFKTGGNTKIDTVNGYQEFKLDFINNFKGKTFKMYQTKVTDKNLNEQFKSMVTKFFKKEGTPEVEKLYIQIIQEQTHQNGKSKAFTFGIYFTHPSFAKLRIIVGFSCVVARTNFKVETINRLVLQETNGWIGIS